MTERLPDDVKKAKQMLRLISASLNNAERVMFEYDESLTSLVDVVSFGESVYRQYANAGPSRIVITLEVYPKKKRCKRREA